MATPTYTKAGNKATVAAKLPKAIFAVENVNHDLMKQAYNAYLANGRTNNAVTKTRGLVSGGGKKPWRQKGTGRARFGSSRVPIWRGGGITFGPTGTENYSHRLPGGVKRTALCQALTLKNDKVSIVEAFEPKDNKTAEAVKLLGKLQATRNVLLVVDNKTDELKRATNNVPDLKVVQASYLSVYDIMNADSIIMTTKALEIVDQWLGGKK